MEASLIVLVVLVLAATSASHIRYARDIPGASAGSGAGSGSYSGSSSSSYSSSSGTKVAPGPEGYGNFNAFSSNSAGPSGGSGGGQFGQQPFGFPAFNPFVPQYGQQYPYTPFPTFAAPFDFMTFLNQYFQSLQNFQAQAEQAAQNAAASGYGIYHKTPGHTVWAYSYPRSAFFPFLSGYPTDSNEVGGSAVASYSPQGGYGSANVFPAPEGGLETRFGGGDEAPQNSVGGPVTSVSGKFKPPGGSSYGVFTSSSSGSSDVNGKKTSFKQSSIGINDNGKVTTYTAHDP